MKKLVLNDKTKLALALLVAVTLVLCAVVVFAQDTLVRDGATCDIPDGYNTAPYSADFNARGMRKFCVFPAKPFADAFKKYLESFAPPELPECEEGLVFGTTVRERPCYKVVTE